MDCFVASLLAMTVEDSESVPTIAARASKPLDHPGVDQQPVEPFGFGAGLAGVEHPLAAEHDALLFRKRRVQRNAGGFLEHERDIRSVERFKRRGEIAGPVVDAIDGIVGGEVAWI